MHTLGPDTRAAIISAMERGIPVVMATGKSRGPWVQQLRASLGLPGQSWNLNGPSVFIQGLMVCDSADRIVSSRLLSAPMVHEMDLFASSRGITIIAYTTDDRIVARQVEPSHAAPPLRLRPIPDEQCKPTLQSVLCDRGDKSEPPSPSPCPRPPITA
jgi:hydroxymethylpyrimidine pyrophosphatase-like HAD family hydrolase